MSPLLAQPPRQRRATERRECGLITGDENLPDANGAVTSIGTAFAPRKQSRRARRDDMRPPNPPLDLLIAAPRGFCAGRRPRDPHRRAGDREAWRASLCPARDRPQQVRRRHAEGARARYSSRSSTRCPTACRWSSPRTACPRRCRPKAAERGLDYLDATCPLVSKVHRQAERLVAAGEHILFIGHAGHPEVIGTFGQVPAGSMTLVETVEDAEALSRRRSRQSRLPDPDHAVGGRYRGGAGGAQAALPGDPRAAGRRHLLRDVEPPGRGQGDRACVRPDAGDRRAQFVELAAAGRGGASARARRATLIQRAADLDWAWLDGVRTRRHHRRRVGARTAGARTRRPARHPLRRHRTRGGDDRANRSRSSCRAGWRRRPSPLAVYTHVSAEALGAFLERYDVGELVRPRASPRASRTPTTWSTRRSGRFILTLYEKRVAADDLPFFMALLDHLAAKGLPVPPAIKDRDGRDDPGAGGTARRA